MQREETGHTPARQFASYVSMNILGSLGISAYILADTYFISRAAGADGITALNLILPIYSLIFAIGAMIATFTSSIFNIIGEYILVFPVGMGMPGAALATALAPIVGILICCGHIFSKKSTLRICPALPSLRILVRSCQLGISAFISEMATGVTTMVFNVLILAIAGNLGVAAYGIIANIAIVAAALFNGIVQGSQPLLSKYYGSGKQKELRTIRSLSFGLAFCFAVLLAIFGYTLADPVIRIFNYEKNLRMAYYAHSGFQIYFTGYLFAGMNMVGTGIFSATEKAKKAFVISMLRGFAAIIPAAVLLAKLFGLTGVWSAFPAAEALTLVVMAGWTFISHIRSR